MFIEKKRIDKVREKILIKILRFYKNHISKRLGGNCIYTPTCSEYCIEAIIKRGFIVGSALTVYRLLRCNPFHKGKYDPVPDKKSVKKWLY